MVVLFRFPMANLSAKYCNDKSPLMRHLLCAFIICWFACDLRSAELKAGFAKTDITPTKPTPMWGYGARHAALSTGVRDKLWAKAVVLDIGHEKLALVGLDLGRSPTDVMMERIRRAVKEKAGVGLVMISGSHTHHGPVIELLDEPGKGKGKYADAVSYAQDFERQLIETIVAAAGNVQPAKLGWSSKHIPFNRNRHTKVEPKPVDDELTVIRLEGGDGLPIALLVNYSAHATMLDEADLRFSADWPGQMMAGVEEQLKTNCVFLQGAAGDLSPNSGKGREGIEQFGKAMADEVVDVNKMIQPTAPRRNRLDADEHVFDYETRLPMSNPATMTLFGQAFFPELAAASLIEDLQHDHIHPRMTTIVLNRELALVGGSGEFFCNHSLRLKERSRAAKTIFIGYCNGHHMYFPTIEAASEGGYGADSAVSWVSIGAGEEMTNHALISIYKMLGKFSNLPF